MRWRSVAFSAFLLCPVSLFPTEGEVRASPVSTSLTSGYQVSNLILHTGPEVSRLQVIQIPIAGSAGQKQVIGTLAFDEGTLSVTGSGRTEQGRLIFDVLIGGGIMTAAHTHDSVGFAFLHAELNPMTMAGNAIEYRTIIMQNGQASAPAFQRGTLERERDPPQ